MDWVERLIQRYVTIYVDLVILDHSNQKHKLNVALYNYGKLDPCDLIKPAIEARTQIDVEVVRYVVDDDWE
ncbi:MAG: hypothetical protein ACW98K_02800 [Candidatus Kariarchaeaceae archaeon]|jgi:hypothetical protein